MNSQKVAIAIALVTGLSVVGAYGTKVVAERNQVQNLLETKHCLDCNLKGINLARRDLENVNLEGANLEGANLRGASLRNANLQRANLRNADLEGSDLGCKAFSFSLRADDSSSNLGFKVDPAPVTPPPNAPVGLDLNTTNAGTTLSINLGGCANLTGAELQGATLPNGSIHP